MQNMGIHLKKGKPYITMKNSLVYAMVVLCICICLFIQPISGANPDKCNDTYDPSYDYIGNCDHVDQMQIFLNSFSPEFWQDFWSGGEDDMELDADSAELLANFLKLKYAEYDDFIAQLDPEYADFLTQFIKQDYNKYRIIDEIMQARDQRVLSRIVYSDNLEVGMDLGSLPESVKTELNSHLKSLSAFESMKPYVYTDASKLAGTKVIAVESNVDTGLHAVAFEKDDYIIIAYRGSDDDKHRIFENFEIFPRGTILKYTPVQSFAEEVVAANPNKKYFVTGQTLNIPS